MSRSNPQLTNPAQHFFEWAGGIGQLQWYDKENKKNVPVKMPFEFLVLDELSTVTGYSKQNESGFWANEVRNVTTDELFVRTKKGPFEAGLYSTLAQTRAKGGKYAKSIYLAHKIGDEWVIGNFKAAGSALSAWIEFTKTLRRGDLEKGKVTMTKGPEQEAPTGKFFAPLFTYTKADPTEDAEAVRLDKEMQIYLNQYLAAPKVDDDGNSISDDDTLATPDQIAEFEQKRDVMSVTNSIPSKPDVVIEDISDEPINLDDIPF